ncbi:MAG: hypothetical protein COA66_10120 [Arcobacter sp.]|nr:MAG: hypothetical protein COA66_10120 [Arcobacter sp.]
MKVKTKDKIAYVARKSNVKPSFWKRFKKEMPKKFDILFEHAKKGDVITVKNDMVSVHPVIPTYKSIGFSEYSIEEKSNHEQFINKTADALLEYIEAFELIGACMTIPYFYKLFLEKHDVPIDVEYGVFELNNRFSVHSWNNYNGKIIDLTSFLQKENISGNAIVMNRVLKKGKDEILYHRADQLPNTYLDAIEVAAKDEILNEDSSNSDYLKCMLDTDAFICSALKRNMNSPETIKREILPNNAEEYRHFEENFASRFA